MIIIKILIIIIIIISNPNLEKTILPGNICNNFIHLAGYSMHSECR